MTSYRIAMVAACPFPCERGTPVRIHRMAESLLERGHEMHVVTYHLSDPVPLHKNLQVHRIRDVPSYRKMSPGPTPRKLLLIDVLLMRRLSVLLQQQDFDVIHAHHVEGLMAALLARRTADRRIPVVFDAHTLLESELPFYAGPSFRRPVSRVGRWIDWTLSAKADYLIAVTEDIRQRLVDLGATTLHASCTIGNGVELGLFRDLQPRRRSNAEQECILIFTGNLAPYQGVEPLLHAFAALRKARNNLTLRIVTQSSFAPFEPLARELNVYHAIELIDDAFEAVPRWLACSDIAINPRIEAPGLPQKTMNYMAAGMPIASFEGSGQHLEHGKTALLAPGRAPSSLAQTIETLVEDPQLASRLGDAARAHVTKQMGWEHTAMLVEEVYAAVTHR